LISIIGPIARLRYYVTHETELSVSPDNSYSLTIWAYGIGSDANRVIGNFQWDGSSQTGSLSSNDVGDVEELDLSNCKMTP
jgi:hypothetical protein